MTAVLLESTGSKCIRDVSPVDVQSITDQAKYGRETLTILSDAGSSSRLEAANVTSTLM